MDADGYFYVVDRAKDMLISGGLTQAARAAGCALGKPPAGQTGRGRVPGDHRPHESQPAAT